MFFFVLCRGQQSSFYCKSCVTVYSLFCLCLSEAIEKEKAEKEVQWLQSLDDDQCHGLPVDVKKNIVQQHVAKLQQKKLRYWPPHGQRF